MEMVLLESDFDDEIEILALFAMEEDRLKRELTSTSRRGSVVGRKVIKHDYLQGQEMFFCDYFAPHLFRKKFRMSCPHLFHLQFALEAHDPYFIQKRNVVRILGLSFLKKMIAALRTLAYGVVADFTDKYVRMRESTAIQSKKNCQSSVFKIIMLPLVQM